MVIEGIITTENDDGSMHIAPIGPHVSDDLQEWSLKPFQTSTTFSNLHRTGRGVFHTVDDALLMVAAVLGYCNPPSPLDPSHLQELTSAQFDPAIGWKLDLGCRYFALSIRQWNLNEPRADAPCVVTSSGTIKPFWGWNRARHSLLELAIIASRTHLLEAAAIAEELHRHEIIIRKTAGHRELQAWELLKKRLSP